MAKDIKSAQKLTGKFSIDKKIKTPIVEIYCERCTKVERVVAYEDDLGKIRFSRRHFECNTCGTIVCELCADGSIRCRECDVGVLYEVTPKSGHEFCKKLRDL
jgi:hypothetical protein